MSLSDLPPRPPAEHEDTVSSAEVPGPVEPRSRPLRLLYLVVGWVSMGLAIAGVILPLVPATPFVLLAAAAFVRSSPRIYQRLVAHPRLGPLLVQWRTNRSVPRSAKRKAYVLVLLSFATSIALLDSTALRLLLAALGTGLCIFLHRLPTERQE